MVVMVVHGCTVVQVCCVAGVCLCTAAVHIGGNSPALSVISLCGCDGDAACAHAVHGPHGRYNKSHFLAVS